MTKAALVGMGLSLCIACVVQQPPPQQGYRYQQSNAAPGATVPYGYTPHSNTRWSNLGESQYSTGRRVDPSSVSRDGIREPMRGFSGAKATGFRVAYARSADTELDKVREAFEKERVFETIAAELNKLIKLPGVVDIHLVDCGAVNAFYDQNNSRIILCYEFVSYLAKMFRAEIKDETELGKAVIGATLFAFFHELGHALRHQLDLPLTGKEEDAVDQLATLILMEGGDEGVEAALAGAYWFGLQAGSAETEQLPFWDEHSLDQQRFYNIACLVYGSDKTKYARLVNNKQLPASRAKRCPQEYRQISGAWEKLLAPHMVSRGAVATNTQPRHQPEPQPQPQPNQETVTCEALADHAIALAVKDYGVALNQLSEEELALLQSQLEQLRATAVQQCYAENWPQSARACVMQSSTLAEAEGCGI